MPKNGGLASIFTTEGAGVPFAGEACSRVGSTSEFYITDRAKSWLDPATPPTVTVGGVATVPVDIDLAAGFFTLASYTSGTVLITGAALAQKWLGGGYGFDIQPKTDKQECTTFPSSLNTVRIWRKYIATLKDWSATISRHYWYGRAWTLLDCTNANSDLVWIWKSYGTKGNLEQVVYVGGGALEVARVGHVTTVTVAAGTTAADIKAHVEADPVLSLLWAVDYASTQTGAGVVEAKSVQTCSGGRDHSSDIAKLGTKILVRFYLDVTTGSLEIISGVGMLEGVPEDVKLEGLIEADLNLQGDGRLKYHTL